MAFDWLTRAGAWMYGVRETELAEIEKALPALARVGALLQRANPLIQRGLVLYKKAAPIIDEVPSLVDELIPLMKDAAPLIEKAREEADDLLPVYRTLLDIITRHRTAGTDGIREVVYTLQSAYPPVRSDGEVIASVKSTLSVGEIRYIQQRLKLDADGIFGRQTLRAVKDFQKANNLAVDGWPGKVTKALLDKKEV